MIIDEIERIGYEELDSVVSQVISSDGETPPLTRLKTLLRFAEDNEEPIYLSSEDLEAIESYM